MRVVPLEFPTLWCQGGLHFYDGRYDKALRGFFRLCEIYPENPVAQFYYALTLAYIGKVDQAFLLAEQEIRSKSW